MQTILVTGANGFIGSHTLSYLEKQKNIKLIAACRDKQKLFSEFQGEIREGDFRDKQYVKTLLTDVDVIVNAMAWTSLWGHRKQSNELFYQPTIRLIEQYLKSKATRFVNLSTTSAAAPTHSSDAMSKGIPRHFWPHLNNVIKIEDYLRAHSTVDKSVINMRLGIFSGERYALGILPILLPRLKTHLVPWIKGGTTHLPIADGRDYGQAMGLAALNNSLEGYHSFNIVGKSVPTMRELISYLHEEFSYPMPHFSVPFWIAYPFAWSMEKLDSILPWEPLIVRSIVHLLEETNADNEKAAKVLGYQPQYDWKDAVRLQISEMKQRQHKPMSMAKPV